MINLQDIDPSNAQGDQKFTFIGASKFTGNTDLFELRTRETSDGVYIVSADLNHDKVADFSFEVHAAKPPVTTDFLL